MNEARVAFAAAKLADGRVLACGGDNGVAVSASAELYDPATGAWAPVASLKTARRDFALAVLKNGWVLAIGGTGATGAPLASVEALDPASGKWRRVRPLATARFAHTATVLDDGRVLVTGGCTSAGCTSCTATAELFDPANGRWWPASPLAFARSGHTSTEVAGGDVLIVGGLAASATIAAAERWRAATQAFEPAGAPIDPRREHAKIGRASCRERVS
jgi:N-acetylneuraminic acid mutarotase